MMWPIMVLLICHVVSGQRTSNMDDSRLVGPDYLFNVLIQKMAQQQQATNNLSQQLMNVYQEIHQINSTAQHSGWILVQQHYNGSTYFNRGWNDYKNGFGNIRGDYWIGNDWLHLLTSSGRYKVRFDLQAKNNSQWYWAEYSTFSVGSESTNYTMTVSGYTGTAGDSFSHHNGRMFQTLDRNNADGCATGKYGLSGGWWWSNCNAAAINASPLLYSSIGPRGFYWGELPVGTSGTTDRQLLTSRMWLVPL